MARSAADPGAALPVVRNPSPVLYAALALRLLLAATALTTYKPRGTTGFGQRKQCRP